MPSRSRLDISRLIACLALLAIIPGPAFPQVKPVDYAVKCPGLEGLYEVRLPGGKTTVMQVYFKDGSLRTVDSGDASSTAFAPVEGAELRFAYASSEKGTFRLEFLKDEQGRFTKFRATNPAQKLDVIGTKIADFDDAKADPASPSDRRGYFERHYSKTEVMVPMRDGVRLFTQVYSPIDGSERHPIILFRTPYGIAPYGDAFANFTMPSLLFMKENYILVGQEVRGTYKSEGTFHYFRPFVENKKGPADIDESSDAYDTVDWLLENVPGHNGKVGAWGISYPGFTATMTALASHPAVAAASPQAPMADLFMGDDGLHNGALYLAHYANYVYTMGQKREAPTEEGPSRLRFPTPDGYAFYLGLGPLRNLTAKVMGPANEVWRETMAHEPYDAYWQAHSTYPHLRGVKPAILVVGGWYDAEDLGGTLQTYKTIERRQPGLRNSIVMGPWLHSGWNLLAGGSENRGPFAFSGTRLYFQEKIELPFFNYYLKGKGTLDIPEAVVFETGTDQWRTFDAWPPAGAGTKKVFFAGSGRLSFDAPAGSAGPGFDEFPSDPAKPVPYTQQITARYNREYFVEDQRFAASRPDVLVYASEPLADDVTITGPIKAELYVSTTGTDADWVVKVIDVYPDDSPDPKPNPLNVRLGGYQRLVRGDIFRGKFRTSFEKPEPFVPGRVAKVAFELPDVQHAFLKGHRIMVQVQSSWFPLFDRNPQKYCDIRTAGEKDFRKALHRLYRTKEHPSSVEFRILTKAMRGF
ncbi:MAG TPA: CocE/NonD family hydrolase [Candidatus Aminicenantes bacterium]|nr:CocE/NonD family hydrolase [Candidatus Aminicenantes bacterium]HRY65537.1 CocE/NonD family hydrolase [Candidatus Aminicenantes bacterium]HRZ72575.1 CocE/NonD family hydrolase [Candidatus Aminicenantes bacterium]